MVRSGNGPVGDYAELVTARALNGKLVANFAIKSYDLKLPDRQSLPQRHPRPSRYP